MEFLFSPWCPPLQCLTVPLAPASFNAFLMHPLAFWRRREEERRDVKPKETERKAFWSFRPYLASKGGTSYERNYQTTSVVAGPRYVGCARRTRCDDCAHRRGRRVSGGLSWWLCRL